jgi:membrane dipeptidase
MTRNVADATTLIDGLQYCNWSLEIFSQMREGGMSAVHATVSYHEGFRDTVRNLVEWNWRFRDHADLILPGRSADDIAAAKASERTAIFLGLQNPMPIEDDLGLVAILHDLGIRFMQLTYNNQSLLGAGWMEAVDGGVTRMGREVIAEMNRLGMAIDMSHSGERTTLEAIALSTRPIAITHANPSWWRETGRNISAEVVKALAKTGGMLGLSIYPHHLRDSGATTMQNFCAMAAEVATMIGVDNLGIGSDLCQGQPDNVVQWMREGRWTRPDPGSAKAAFPAQPSWFRDNRDFPGLAAGLKVAGFGGSDTAKVLGENWRNFIRKAFEPGGPS